MKLAAGARLPLKRRRMRKTDYRYRLALLKSGLPRMVVRRSHAAIHVQFVTWKFGDSDRTVVEVSSTALRKLGWKWHCGSVPAAYLTGLISGKSALEAGITSAVADFGLQKVTKGCALLAAVQGARDAGISIPVGEEKLPDPSRLRGEHIAAYAASLRQRPELYKRQFGKHEDPETLPQAVDAIRAKVLAKGD